MIKNKGHILGLSFLELIKRKPPLEEDFFFR